jgi:hypothetical protein
VVVVPYDKGSGANCRLRQNNKDLPTNQILLTELQIEDVPPVQAITQTEPATKTSFAFGDASLLGFDWDPAAQRPGNNFILKAYWRANDTIERDYKVVARLSDQKGQVIQESVTTLGTPSLPTSRWQKGREVLTYIAIPIPKRAESGSYKLSLALQTEGLEQKTFGDFPPVVITARDRSFTAPQPANTKTADFGGLIELLGYDLQPGPDQTIAGGQALSLTLHWKAIQEVADNYKVFVHLVGPDGQIYGQADALPLKGNAPTNEWIAGEVLKDQYSFAVKQGAPAGEYKLVIGFYKPEGNVRLPLTDGTGESLTLTTLKGNPQGQ